MNIFQRFPLFYFLASISLVNPTFAQTNYNWKQLGEFKTRDAKDIKSSTLLTLRLIQNEQQFLYLTKVPICRKKGNSQENSRGANNCIG